MEVSFRVVQSPQNNRVRMKLRANRPVPRGAEMIEKCVTVLLSYFIYYPI